MSKTKRPLLRLFFDFEFTSLSPDALPISLGIVSDDIEQLVPTDEVRHYDNDTLHLKQHKILVDNGFGLKEDVTKSFYAEFNDFDINRCDDWVKENVIKKLEYYNDDVNGKMHEGWKKFSDDDVCCLMEDEYYLYSSTNSIIKRLKKWLEQFNDFDIQFVADCGTFDWFWMLQLIDERASEPHMTIDVNNLPDNFDAKEFIKEWEKAAKTSLVFKTTGMPKFNPITPFKIGLPKFPKNISPIPQDLNDLIAYKKGISIKAAFELDRSWLANDYTPKSESSIAVGKDMVKSKENKHNSLWDAKATKMIFNNLK